MKFLERMFTAFLARHMPDSTQAKPRFMKNTRKPVINTHTVSAATVRFAVVFCNAATGSVSGAAGGIVGVSATASAVGGAVTSCPQLTSADIKHITRSPAVMPSVKLFNK